MIHNRDFNRVLLFAGAALLFSFLLIGCGGQDQSGSPDTKTVETHKLRPPMPSAVPKGMNK